MTFGGRAGTLKRDENFVQLFLPLCDLSDHGVRVIIRSVLVEQG